ncbi:hypothetical protein KR018_005780, partial [Drosophila ironensis]
MQFVQSNGAEMDYDIGGFYKDKVVFLTGATGFMGKVMIEKLLRSTDVKRIYAMVRSKRGHNLQERLQLWQKEEVSANAVKAFHNSASQVFKVLLSSKPEALQRVQFIAGDCCEPDLGIREEDRRLLCAEVHIVIHGAATVRFDEALHKALAINTRATRLMLQLAKEMKHLESYLHISTAFSNCVILDIEEKFYPEHLPCSADNVLALSEMVNNKVLDNMSAGLMGSFPNTYIFTKALAEDIVLKESGSLPVSICRPNIIMSADKEPMVGWIDNLYGPIGFAYGAGMGVLRVICVNLDAHSNLVPVDYASNLAIAIIWETSRKKSQCQQPAIYAIGNASNPIDYSKIKNAIPKYRKEFPMTNMLWYPYLLNVTSMWTYYFLAFFLHTLPGYALDLALRVVGRKPQFGKIYKKINDTMKLLHYFNHNTFRFDMKNTYRLWELMSPKDRITYNFDINSLDWDKYIIKSLRAIPFYVGKEVDTPESIAKGKKLMLRLVL